MSLQVEAMVVLVKLHRTALVGRGLCTNLVEQLARVNKMMLFAML